MTEKDIIIIVLIVEHMPEFGVFKKFGGETFKMVWNGGPKSEAKRVANEYRRAGYLARVHDSGYEWQVYAKEKLYNKAGKRITR